MGNHSMVRGARCAISAAAAVVFLVLGGEAGAHAPSGAIFTTTENGDTVNGNLYDQKKDVFLDGGPGPGAPRNAAGLDDGLYVFQVTDPSSMVLLSEDAAECRVVKVESGVIVARMDWAGSGTDPTDFSLHGGNDACHRNNGSNGPHRAESDLDHGPPAIVVQLLPYLDTPNPGGVYKAWMSFLEDFVNGCAAQDKSGDQALSDIDCGSPNDVPGNFHGFIPAHSKTDNFKVRERGGRRPPAQLITVKKYCDVDCDGVRNVGLDVCLDGVQITVTQEGGGVVCQGATVGGFFDCAAPEPGRYVIAETLGTELTVCGASVDGVAQGAVTEVTVDIGSGRLDPLFVEFGNTASDGEITATKTCYTTGEPIAGVQIDLSGDATDTDTTALDGTVSFPGLTAGTYTLTEVLPVGLAPIGPTSCTVTLGVDTSLDLAALAQCTAGSENCDFVNVAVGNVGARTPGFWCSQSLREAGENPGENAACFQQLVCSFGSVQTVINGAFDFWMDLGGAQSEFDRSGVVDGSDGISNEESQQILCPQVGEAEQFQCHRQLFALLESVWTADIAGGVGCDQIGCNQIGVTQDQLIVVDGQLSTVGAVLQKVVNEGCTDVNGELLKDVNENNNTVLPTCPADVTP